MRVNLGIVPAANTVVRARVHEMIDAVSLSMFGATPEKASHTFYAHVLVPYPGNPPSHAFEIEYGSTDLDLRQRAKKMAEKEWSNPPGTDLVVCVACSRRSYEEVLEDSIATQLSEMIRGAQPAAAA